MKKYILKTFGCEMNKADSEKIKMTLFQLGFKEVKELKEADLFIFNTCSVRQKGEDRVFGMMQKIKRQNKNIKIGITGCMVRKTGLNNKYLSEIKKREATKKITYIKNSNGIFNNDDKLFPRLKTLDFVFRIEEIKYLSFLLSTIFGKNYKNDDKVNDYLKIPQYRKNNFSASVIIQTGCDNFCTYCIVPFSRGKELSRESDEILKEIKELALKGVKEISLVGQNVNSYSKQKNLAFWNMRKSTWNKEIGISPFRKLLNDINKIDGINRIRFTSSNPHDMTKDILDSHFELDKTCNHLHFALQSGNDEILKKMNRKHTYNDFKKMVEYLRRKDPLFSISTDIIVGFSGETERMFLDSVKALEELEIDFVYIARYSVRKGTIAEKKFADNVSEGEKAKRWHILNEVLKKNVKKRFKKMLGREEEILISGENKDKFFGRTRNFKEVYFPKIKDIKIGDLVKVKITEMTDWNLLGEII